jgi:hypothetical protein
MTCYSQEQNEYNYWENVCGRVAVEVEYLFIRIGRLSGL